MRIYPIFYNNSRVSDKGRNSSINFSAPYLRKLDYQNSNDVFVRLAIASTRDINMENELKAMGLI